MASSAFFKGAVSAESREDVDGGWGAPAPSMATTPVASAMEMADPAASKVSTEPLSFAVPDDWDSSDDEKVDDLAALVPATAPAAAPATPLSDEEMEKRNTGLCASESKHDTDGNSVDGDSDSGEFVAANGSDDADVDSDADEEALDEVLAVAEDELRNLDNVISNLRKTDGGETKIKEVTGRRGVATTIESRVPTEHTPLIRPDNYLDAVMEYREAVANIPKEINRLREERKEDGVLYTGKQRIAFRKEMIKLDRTRRNEAMAKFRKKCPYEFGFLVYSLGVAPFPNYNMHDGEGEGRADGAVAQALADQAGLTMERVVKSKKPMTRAEREKTTATTKTVAAHAGRRADVPERFNHVNALFHHRSAQAMTAFYKELAELDRFERDALIERSERANAKISKKLKKQWEAYEDDVKAVRRHLFSLNPELAGYDRVEVLTRPCPYGTALLGERMEQTIGALKIAAENGLKFIYKGKDQIAKLIERQTKLLNKRHPDRDVPLIEYYDDKLREKMAEQRATASATPTRLSTLCEALNWQETRLTAEAAAMVGGEEELRAIVADHPRLEASLATLEQMVNQLKVVRTNRVAPATTTADDMAVDEAATTAAITGDEVAVAAPLPEDCTLILEIRSQIGVESKGESESPDVILALREETCVLADAYLRETRLRSFRQKQLLEQLDSCRASMTELEMARETELDIPRDERLTKKPTRGKKKGRPQKTHFLHAGIRNRDGTYLVEPIEKCNRARVTRIYEDWIGETQKLARGGSLSRKYEDDPFLKIIQMVTQGLHYLNKPVTGDTTDVQKKTIELYQHIVAAKEKLFPEHMGLVYTMAECLRSRYEISLANCLEKHPDWNLDLRPRGEVKANALQMAQLEMFVQVVDSFSIRRIKGQVGSGKTAGVFAEIAAKSVTLKEGEKIIYVAPSPAVRNAVARGLLYAACAKLPLRIQVVWCKRSTKSSHSRLKKLEIRRLAPSDVKGEARRNPVAYITDPVALPLVLDDFRLTNVHVIMDEMLGIDRLGLAPLVETEINAETGESRVRLVDEFKESLIQAHAGEIELLPEKYRQERIATAFSLLVSLQKAQSVEILSGTLPKVDLAGIMANTSGQVTDDISLTYRKIMVAGQLWGPGKRRRFSPLANINNRAQLHCMIKLLQDPDEYIMQRAILLPHVRAIAKEIEYEFDLLYLHEYMMAQESDGFHWSTVVTKTVIPVLEAWEKHATTDAEIARISSLKADGETFDGIAWAEDPEPAVLTHEQELAEQLRVIDSILTPGYLEADCYPVWTPASEPFDVINQILQFLSEKMGMNLMTLYSECNQQRTADLVEWEKANTVARKEKAKEAADDAEGKLSKRNRGRERVVRGAKKRATDKVMEHYSLAKPPHPIEAYLREFRMPHAAAFADKFSEENDVAPAIRILAYLGIYVWHPDLSNTAFFKKAEKKIVEGQASWAIVHPKFAYGINGNVRTIMTVPGWLRNYSYGFYHQMLGRGGRRGINGSTHGTGLLEDAQLYHRLRSVHLGEERDTLVIEKRNIEEAMQAAMLIQELGKELDLLKKEKEAADAAARAAAAASPKISFQVYNPEAAAAAMAGLEELRRTTIAELTPEELAERKRQEEEEAERKEQMARDAPLIQAMAEELYRSSHEPKVRTGCLDSVDAYVALLQRHWTLFHEWSYADKRTRRGMKIVVDKGEKRIGAKQLRSFEERSLRKWLEGPGLEYLEGKAGKWL